MEGGDEVGEEIEQIVSTDGQTGHLTDLSHQAAAVRKYLPPGPCCHSAQIPTYQEVGGGGGYPGQTMQAAITECCLNVVTLTGNLALTCQLPVPVLAPLPHSTQELWRFY